MTQKNDGDNCHERRQSYITTKNDALRLVWGKRGFRERERFDVKIIQEYGGQIMCIWMVVTALLTLSGTGSDPEMEV